jgi:hypothetical protein
MLRKLSLLGILALLAAAAPVSVDDTYTIKLKKGQKGAVFTQHKQSSEESSVKIEGPDGKLLQEKNDTRKATEEYKETILEKEKGKKATKLRREYIKAVLKINDNEKELPYQGKTILIEKKEDGKYHFTIEGGAELKGKDAEELNRAFNKEGGSDSDEDALEKAILPPKPVKVNGTWTIDADAIVKSIQRSTKQTLPVDKSKTEGKGKLLKAYKKEGKQFGVLDIEVRMPLKGDFPLGRDQGAPIQEGSKMVLHLKADGCIDGTSSDATLEGSMEIDAKATFKGPDGNDYKLTLHAKQTSKETEKDLAKK